MASFFGTLFGGESEREAADRNRALAAQYGLDANSFLKEGYTQGRTDINSAIGAFQPLKELSDKYGKAGDMYLDALGVNGPEGVQRARSAFTTTPGYDLTNRAALDAIDRRRATTGMYASGNADIDTGNWVTKNLWESQYLPWMQQLQGAGAQGQQAATTAAGGESSGFTNLANLGQQYAQNRVGVSGNVLGQNVAANNLQAQGESAGASRLFNFGTQLLGAAMTGGTSLLAGGMPMGNPLNRVGELFSPAGNMSVGGYSMPRVGTQGMYTG